MDTEAEQKPSRWTDKVPEVPSELPQKGWIPTVTQRLSYSVIGTPKFPRKAIKHGSVRTMDGSERLVFAAQFRRMPELRRYITWRNQKYRNCYFLFIAEPHQDFRAPNKSGKAHPRDCPLQGYIYIFLKRECFRQAVMPHLRTLEEACAKFKSTNQTDLKSYTDQPTEDLVATADTQCADFSWRIVLAVCRI